MRARHCTSHWLLCALTLLLLFQNVHSQDIPAGIPAEWLQTAAPAGGAAPITPTDGGAVGGATPDAGAAVDPAAVGENAEPAQPATDPNAQPATDPLTEPATDPNAQPATDPLTQPATDPNAQPATDPNAQPAVDPNAQAATPVVPVDDPLVQPAAPAGDATAVAPAVAVNPTQGAGSAETDEEAVSEGDDGTDPPNGNSGPSFDDLPPDNLPPGPPMDWQALPLDTEIIFGMDLRGPALVPWTKSKSWVFTNVLRDRYLRSCRVQDIETGPLESFRYSVPIPEEEGTRRRSLLATNRFLLQAQTTVETGVLLRVKVRTNTIRVESEVRSVVDGVSSGSLAKDLTDMLGSEVSNVTLTQQPTTVPYDKLPDPNANSGGSLPGWIIGTIAGAILVLMPIPAYLMYKRRRRRHIEAVEKQAAEAAAARQRMQSRVIKSGGKSFTQHAGGVGSVGGLEAHDILARTGSLAGLSSYQYAPSIGHGSSMDLSRHNSLTPGGYVARSGGSFAGGASRSPQRTPSHLTPQQQQQFLLYQQQSLGGDMPAHRGRATMARQLSGALPVHPMNYSDETSSSSGHVSDPRQ